MRWARTGFGTVAIVLMLSAFWIETDAYRVGAVILATIALSSVRLGEYRPRAGWGEALCVGWCVYVVARIGAAKLAGTRGLGSSEGLYLYPLFFPMVGYALFLLRGQAERIAWTFIAGSFLMLLGTTDFAGLLAGQRVEVLVFNNPIHGSCAAGVIAIAALCWVEHLAAAARPSRMVRGAGVGLGVATAALALVNILGGQSKGVWLAVLVTCPALLAALLGRRGSRSMPAAALLALGLAALVLAATDVWPIAGPTARSSLDAALAMVHAGSLAPLRDMIAAGSLPFTLDQRLMLWLNGWEIWSAHLWFGPGIDWLPMLKTTRYYAEIDYNIFHNGYLEVAVRYGIVGLAAFGVLAAACVRWVVQARRAGLVPSALLHLYLLALLFFAVTLLSNSNNRLSIGESLIVLLGGAAFACRYRLQLAGESPDVQALHRPIDYTEPRHAA